MSDQVWFERTLLRYAAGLCDDAECERFERLRAEDDRCATAWREATDDTVLHDAHVPPALLARWDSAQDRLGELERQCVLDHLERCASCQEDLQLLRSTQDVAADEEAPTQTRPQRPRTPAPAPRRWLQGAATGLVVGLAAGLSLLFIRPQPAVQDSDFLPWVAPTRLRGALPPFSQLRIEAATREIALTIGVPATLDSEQRAQLRILSPDGVELMERALSAEELQRGSLIVILRQAEPLTSGIYEVQFLQDGLSEPLQLSFELQR